MTLDQALQLLRGLTPVGRGEVCQAVVVVLAHARERLDDRDVSEARELAKAAERGLQALQGDVLKPLLWKAKLAGLLGSEVDAADAAIRTLTHLFWRMMRASPPLKTETVEAMGPEAALRWITRLALDVDGPSGKETRQ